MYKVKVYLLVKLKRKETYEIQMRDGTANVIFYIYKNDVTETWRDVNSCILLRLQTRLTYPVSTHSLFMHDIVQYSVFASSSQDIINSIIIKTSWIVEIRECDIKYYINFIHNLK